MESAKHLCEIGGGKTKMTVELIEEKIRGMVREELMKFLVKKHLLIEGIDIDFPNRLVSFNANHQDNVDTNDYLHPYIIENNAKYGTILSIFERKDNDTRNDGNPLVYALKNLNNWRFKDPQNDVFALFRRFVAVTTQLNRPFDTLIVVPSHNQLNNMVFGYLTKLIDFDNYFNSLFQKLNAQEVEENYIDYKKLYSAYNEDESESIRNALIFAFNKMETNNAGVFSYKYIPKSLRGLISKTMCISIGEQDPQIIANALNDKDVLVFDDTVTSGRTLSEVAEGILATFAPKSITFLTLFSPRKSGDFSNTHITL